MGETGCFTSMQTFSRARALFRAPGRGDNYNGDPHTYRSLMLCEGQEGYPVLASTEVKNAVNDTDSLARSCSAYFIAGAGPRTQKRLECSQV